MNKKRILMSSLILIAVAGITIGGTGAFFSDLETSAGNVFTAGAVDLKVDHTRQVYNGVDCQTCSVSIYSSTDTLVASSSAGAASEGDLPKNAELVTTINPAWLPASAVAPAEWIWVTPVVSPADTTNNAEYTFVDTFFLQGPIALDDFELEIASDNGYKIAVNGVTIVDELGTTGTFTGLNPLTPAQESAFQSALIQNGQNSLEITVRNLAATSNSSQNPAGLIYKIDFTNENCEAGVADFQQRCQLWEATDLENQTFFDFSDIKPQDAGENVISLHVDSNDAFACLNVANKEDVENTINNPEDAAGDITDPEGEMGEFLTVKGFYSDINGAEISELFPATPIKDLDTIVYADSTTGTPISGNTTEYIKLNWCMGDFNPDGSCDGNVPDINQTQTDAFLADLQFSVIQTRNNEDYECPVSTN